MFESIRLRLTLWGVAIVAVILGVYSAGVYGLMQRTLYERLDASLDQSLNTAALSLAHETEEHFGKVPGEQAFRTVLNALPETSYPLHGIAVFEGQRLVAAKPDPGGHYPSLPDDQKNRFLSRDGHRIGHREFRIPGAGAIYSFVASQELSELQAQLAALQHIILFVVPLAILLAAGGSYVFVRKTLRPIDEMTRLQKRFMADAAHEFRTPVSIALTSAQVTLQSQTSEETDYRDALGVVEAQMRRLSRLVQDMLTLVLADAGVSAPKKRSFYADELVRDTIKAARVLASAKGIRLDMKSNPETELYADEDLIRQLLLILLDNAIKYTQPGGRVMLELKTEAGRASFQVSDTGPGIPEEARPQIFRRFYRVDKARSRASGESSSGGAGLGLAIGRWIAEAHGGSLELTSSGPDGSVFTASIPRRLKREPTGVESGVGGQQQLGRL